MSMKLTTMNTEANQQDIGSYVDDSLIERLWKELDGQVPRDQITCVVRQIADTFKDATVKAFVPIIIHRQALEHFRKLLREKPLL